MFDSVKLGPTRLATKESASPLVMLAFGAPILTRHKETPIRHGRTALARVGCLNAKLKNSQRENMVRGDPPQ